jgi:hypothetical protein
MGIIVSSTDHVDATPDDVLAVHAALLPTRQIIYFGGDEHDRAQHNAKQVDHTRVFDCKTFQITNPGSPPIDTNPGSPPIDLFCCGHAMLSNGSLLVAGGTEDFLVDPGGDPHAGHFTGLHQAFIYDGFNARWHQVASMTSTGGLELFRRADVSGDPGGRWYPMLVMLANGDVLAMSGHPSHSDKRHNHDMPERFSPSTGNWTLFPESDVTFEVRDSPKVYPRLHLLPDGRVFCSTPIGATPQSQLIDPNNGSRTHAGDPPPDDINIGTSLSQDGTSVLLPLLPSEGYRPRVLLCGGEQPVFMDLQPLLDRPGTSLRWFPTAPRNLPAAPPLDFRRQTPSGSTSMPCCCQPGTSSFVGDAPCFAAMRMRY